MRFVACFNKLFLTLPVALLFFVITVSFCFAQNASPGNNPANTTSVGNNEIKNEVKNAGEKTELMNTFKEAVAEKKDAWSQKRVEIRSQVMTRVRANVGVVGKRYLAAIARYENMVARIEARIQIEKAKGADTSSIEVSLLDVKNRLSAVKSVLETTIPAMEPIDETSSGEDITGVIKEVRDALKEQKTVLKTIHEDLKKIVLDLRSLVLNPANGTEQ